MGGGCSGGGMVIGSTRGKKQGGGLGNFGSPGLAEMDDVPDMRVKGRARRVSL